MTPTAAAIVRLRIRHLLADGTRMALAYGWQFQCEAFHTAEIKFIRAFTRRKYGVTAVARYSRHLLLANAVIAASRVGSDGCDDHHEMLDLGCRP
jgi:hypothetical protein